MNFFLDLKLNVYFLKMNSLFKFCNKNKKEKKRKLEMINKKYFL